MARQERELEERLLQAETGLARAIRRVATLRRRAMYGDYDPQSFGGAIEAYEVAEAEVREARAALVHFLSTRTSARSGPRLGSAFDTDASDEDEKDDLQDKPAVSEREGEKDASPDAEWVVVPAEPTRRLEFVRWLVQTGRLSDN